jgi:hypothetical protein
MTKFYRHETIFHKPELNLQEKSASMRWVRLICLECQTPLLPWALFPRLLRDYAVYCVEIQHEMVCEYHTRAEGLGSERLNLCFKFSQFKRVLVAAPPPSSISAGG